MDLLSRFIIFDQQLIPKIDPWYFKDRHLQIACAFGLHKMVAYLASIGLNVNSRTNSGKSCLFITLNSSVISEEDRKKTIKTLLYYGADPNEKFIYHKNTEIKVFLDKFVDETKYQEITSEMMTDKVEFLF